MSHSGKQILASILQPPACRLIPVLIAYSDQVRLAGLEVVGVFARRVSIAICLASTLDIRNIILILYLTYPDERNRLSP
ncbi:hypothetical protein AJ88_26065 [Mesorhizobium amorphae CCBAU 01583]|nr:hypothetical protein AJ88_26065 [Mesorhizobium amorphae CCBAU 01583]